MKGPLAEIVVLDLSRALAGPFCTLMLGDMGADIIKIEVPRSGDEARQWGPPFLEEESAYFLSVNRNKRSFTLNLKASKGKEIFKDLARKADVVIENFRPGTMKKLGVDYPVLKEINPGLIYCSITGFGPSGPEANRPGYDLIAQGMGGFMSFTGEAGGPPLKVGVSQADITAGMFAAYGILVAIIHRKNTGEGQCVETSLFESQVAQLTFQAGRYFATGEAPEPMGNQHPLIAPYETFRAKDGYINIAVGNNALWSTFCKAMGLEEKENDPRFETNPKRLENRKDLITVIEEKTSTRNIQEIREILDGAGIPNGPVSDLKEVLNSPQALARDMVVEINHSTLGPIKITGIPVKLSSTAGSIQIPPPVLGEHTALILQEFLGMNPEDIEKLKNEEVI
jgi:crotonobetainyl-CoA:carnitine CoA-transferase CaiB-like acyl-CoA transferase